MSVRSSPVSSPMSPHRVRRRGPGSIDTSDPAHTPPHMSATPRSTLGSPLTSHATRRSGSGDLAAGPCRRRISLSDVEVLPWLCCMAPVFLVFGGTAVVTLSAFLAPTLFFWLTAFLTSFSVGWIVVATGCAFWAYLQMCSATKKDWQAMLEEVQQVDPDGSSTLHIVILPNYKENENMLKATLENLGRSPMASTRVRVVLGMEAREGQAAHEKANRLIQETSHLFADIFATFHPEGLPGETPGKSSNTQWAFREACRHVGPILLGYDLSRVFVTVGDADTLWHPLYLSAVTYSALMMPEEERVWRIWQPPVLLVRNMFSVPQMTRNAAHATLIFELFGLGCPKWIAPAFAYSAYTLTMALASHPEVDGWDADVIAEDHHMFCKCYFAALWEQVHCNLEDKKKNPEAATLPITPQVQVEPVYVPAVSYLVESGDGYWASVWARFEQARRHIQGVIELGYCLLQYVRLMYVTGINGVPKKTHFSILTIALKIYIVEIQTNIQTWALVMAALTNVVPQVAGWILNGGLFGGISQVGSMQLDSMQSLLFWVVANISGFSILFALTASLVVLGTIQGDFYAVLPPTPRTTTGSMVEGDEDEQSEASACSPKSSHLGTSSRSPRRGQSPSRGQQQQQQGEEPESQGMPDFVQGPLSLMGKLKLHASVYLDTVGTGYPTMFLYGLVPLWMAAWSLLRRGTDFEYIVAMKPE